LNINKKGLYSKESDKAEEFILTNRNKL